MTLAILQVKPGIQRDGTDLDSDTYVDGQWVRFQRGRPKKMGGYRRIADNINGPVNGTHVWNRQSTNLITLFSGSGIEQVQVNNDFIGATIYDRTPSAWVTGNDYVWQYSTLFDAAAGSNKTLLIAHASHSMDSIDDGTAADVYYGDADGNGQMTAMGSEWQVSGGIVAASPYLIAYGSDGKVIWSNANEPRNATTGDAGTARVTDKKIVKGLPIRGTGRSPSVLLWSLDSLILMSYIGGQAIFNFNTITNQISVLSTNSIIEYDGMFFWAGLDRFMVYNGQVQEVPNNTNLNYFYDRLNFKQRQKVFALKVPRYGEIWWFFPTGDSEDCNNVVIYNVREKTWYDTVLNRTSGSSAQTVRNPVMVDSTPRDDTIRLRLTSVTGQFLIGDIVTGAFSGATGRVTKVVGTTIYLTDVVGIFRGNPSEGISSANGSASTTAMDAVSQYSAWVHEVGKNKIEGDNELSIRSHIETCDISLATGATGVGSAAPVDAYTRLSRVEPDFILVGPLTMNIMNQKTAQSPVVPSRDYIINSDTPLITAKEQGRVMRIKFTSDALNGDFEMGKILVDIDSGDVKV